MDFCPRTMDLLKPVFSALERKNKRHSKEIRATYLSIVIGISIHFTYSAFSLTPFTTSSHHVCHAEFATNHRLQYRSDQYWIDHVLYGTKSQIFTAHTFLPTRLYGSRFDVTQFGYQYHYLLRCFHALSRSICGDFLSLLERIEGAIPEPGKSDYDGKWHWRWRGFGALQSGTCLNHTGVKIYISSKNSQFETLNFHILKI